MWIKRNTPFKNTIYFYIAQIIGKLLYFVLLVIISRYLGAIGLGQYGSSFAIVSISFIFVNIGLDSLFIREISRYRKRVKDDLLNLFLLKVSLAFGALILILLIAYMVYGFADIRNIIIILGIAGFVGSLTQVFNSIFIAYEKIKHIMIFFITRDFLIVGLSIFALLFGGTLLHVSFCFLIGTIAAFVFALVLLIRLKIKPVFKINYSTIGNLLRKSIPFTLSTLFLFMFFRIDIIMLKLLKGNYSAGIYRVTTSFLTNLEVFPHFFMMALYPRFSRLFMKKKLLLVRLYKKSSFYLFCLNSILLLLIFIVGKKLILLMFGKGFLESSLLLQRAIFPFFFLFQNSINHYLFYVMDRPDLGVIILGLGILINFILNLIYIPPYSYYGVIYSIIFSYIFIYLASTLIINFNLLPKYVLNNSKTKLRT